jgi:outer membrane receptor for ferrienterochelin and colicin
MKRLQFCLAVFAVLALTFSAFAQVQNGQFTGTVTDPTGAAIANAKVTVTNEGTNLTVSATTNSGGNYTAKELPIGSYKLTVEAPGFKTTSDTKVVLNAGVIAHVDFKLQIGNASEVIEVTGAAVAVQTEDSRLYSTVSGTELSNTVLQGRDVFDLMQLSAGAVSVAGTDFENGHNTVVNGLREDFNGFLINGVSNKGLSGGEESTPMSDTVEEFQQLGLNMSAQYGNSAGSTVNLVTKSGTNSLHGSVFEYIRNEDADANDFFVNQVGGKRAPYRWNQFGGTVGGPIIKDKLFFFLAYEKSYFITSSPASITEESPEWRNAVHQADLNQAGQSFSVADLLYSKFTPSLPGINPTTLDTYITSISPGSTSGFASYADYVCPDSYGPSGMGGTSAQANAIATRMQAILGVVPTVDNATPLTFTGAPCSTPLTGQAGTVGRDPTSPTGASNLPFQVTSAAQSKTRTASGSNFFNGRRMSGRLDYNWNVNNRISGNFQWQRNTDEFGPCPLPSCTRGFQNNNIVRSANAQFSYTHTFSPTVLNEFRAGYVQNVNNIGTGAPGVPQINFDDASLGFGSYNGYPQFFKENIYSYSDMVSVSHGNHNMKIGVDVRRNIENSLFNVARSSYYFSDPIFFAADAPYTETAGVNPGICAPPCSQATIQGLVTSGTVPNAQLAGNQRHWRNVELGAYFQDDWKVTKRLTLQLGLRYDLYKRHNEEANAATLFYPGPGSNIQQQLINANVPAGSIGTIGGTTYDCTSAAAQALDTIQGVCGPGGFGPATALGKGRHKDFGPRVGFAWDLFGDGKTALRGGFGISYEGTLYNPLSNSRWNLPYYSFNNVTNFIGGDTKTVVYGPTTCTVSVGCTPNGGAQFGPGGATPAYNGPPTNPNQGVGVQATGNVNGWYGQSPNLALLTGIITPKGIDDPYVYNFYLGFQHEILSKTVLEVNYVGTAGHKLFRAEDINRLPGTLLPAGSTIVNNIGETLVGSPYSTPSLGSRPNPNYGKLRTWENVVNSNYNSLQASLKRQLSHGLLVNVNYTYSHSIDDGSTWHSGGTTAAGASGGDGFTTDPTIPGLDRGNSVYDVRHRLVVNHVWQMPGYNMKGPAGYVVGGWSLSGIWAFQSGAHWSPFNARGPNLRTSPAPGAPHCTAADVNSGNCVNLGGDYLLTRGRNERPDSSVSGFGSFSHSDWANGWNNGYTGTPQPGHPVLSAPCLGCNGNLGRNTFVGPNYWSTDLTLSKNFRLTERFNLKFDAAAFNVFNRANFLLATSGGGAHNEIHDGLFGKAGGTTLNGVGPRTMQFGLKLSF